MGSAFGLGIECLCTRRHQIDDVRLTFQNDVRFLRQFSRDVFDSITLIPRSHSPISRKDTMSKLSRKSRRALAFRPEILERRELLSTGMLPHHQHADVIPFARGASITGLLSGEATFTSTSFDFVGFKYASTLKNVSGTLQGGAGAASLAGAISGKGAGHTASVFSKGLTLSART